MPDRKIAYFAFTTKFSCLSNRLYSKANIVYEKRSYVADALWDTGATISCISMDVVSKLGLVSTGKMEINTPAGKKEVNTYSVDIVLPNKVQDVLISNCTVCDSDIGDQGISLLIGMDIIQLGDFSVSNYGGQTVFSFRLPSKETTDYVKKINFENAIGPTHGKGNRKRKK